MISRSAIHVIAAVGAAVVGGLGAPADAKDIAFKIDEPTARRLAAEGAGHGATPESLELMYDDPRRVSPPFFIYDGLSPPPADGSFGFFAVNPWTGDVWALLWECGRLSTPALRKSQAEIRQRFTAEERKQYPKLRGLQPRCITD